MRDSLLAIRGQVTLRVLDAATGAVLRVHEGPNAISYMSPVILIDLLVQSNFDSSAVSPETVDYSLATAAEHPADASRGFALAETLVPSPIHNAIRYMRVGTDATAAARTDTALVSPVAGAESFVRISNIDFPTNNSVRFVGTLGAEQANGNTLREVALLTRGNTSKPVTDPSASTNSRVFARRVTTPSPKDDTVQFEYAWTLSFA